MPRTTDEPKYRHRVRVLADVCFTIQSNRSRITRQEIIQAIEDRLGEHDDGFDFPALEDGRVYTCDGKQDKISTRKVEVMHTQEN